MKIGFLIDDHMARPGGVQEYVRGLYRYLVQHGHDAVIFSSGGGRPHDDLHLIPLGSALPLRGSGSTTSIPLTLASPRRLRALLEREACDVLHVMAPYSPSLSGRLLVQSRAIHVQTFLVAIEPGPYRAALGMLARLQARSLRRFDARIAISPTAAATGRALYGGSYMIIPCGVDTAAFAPRSDRAAKPDGRIDLVYVGRLEQRKGVIHLIRAFARLQRQHPHLHLIIGGDGPQRPALEHMIRQLRLDRVELRGYVPADDLPDLLRSADIFCAPATYAESFGIVLIEALAAGVPIVAAGNAGYADLLAAHSGNMVVPPGDDRALAGAIAALVDQPAYRAQLGERNLHAAARYDWQQVGNEIAALYHQLLSR